MLRSNPYSYKQLGVPHQRTHLRCRGSLDFNYEGDTTKTNFPHCFLHPHNHQRNFIFLWKLQGTAELPRLMKCHWQVGADLIERSTCLGSHRAHISGRLGSLLTANSLFLSPFLPSSLLIRHKKEKMAMSQGLWAICVMCRKGKSPDAFNFYFSSLLSVFSSKCKM